MAAQHYKDFEDETPTQTLKQSAMTVSQGAFDEVEDSFLDLKGTFEVKVAMPDRVEIGHSQTNATAGVPSFLAAHIA